MNDWIKIETHDNISKRSVSEAITWETEAREDNIKTNLNTYILRLCVINACYSEHGPKVSCYDHGTENSGYMKGKKFI